MDPHLQELADLLVKVAIRQVVHQPQTKGLDQQTKPNTETSKEIKKAGTLMRSADLCIPSVHNNEREARHNDNTNRQQKANSRHQPLLAN